MYYIQGDILTLNGLEKGYLGFEQGKILDKGNGIPPKKPVAKGLILPTFINAHTHIGDTFIGKRKQFLPRNVEKLVAPPDGLKHRLLRETSEKEILRGMKQSVSEMIDNGTSCFWDFRENGLQGVNQLKQVVRNTGISSVILSRPMGLKYNECEIETLLKGSQGIGISSISDWDYSALEKIAKHTKKRGKLFVLHASETYREDINCILDLRPDILIHMIYATQGDLEIVRDQGIPIVLCPRANAFFSLKPDLKLMKETGVSLLLGTDNAMISTPNVLDEIKYIIETTNVFSLTELFNMVTYLPRKVLSHDYEVLGVDSLADFIVLDKKYLKPIAVSGAQGR
jgi:cytosine/adenosine deaminase-related metal-dependent hydrolase